jgi:hypothetical protein
MVRANHRALADTLPAVLRLSILASLDVRTLP